MECDAVDWTKVTFDPSKLFFKNHMVESGIEFANSGGSRCDIHRFLTSTEHHLQNGTRYSTIVKLLESMQNSTHMHSLEANASPAGRVSVLKILLGAV